MNCRVECGACCAAPSISSPLPGMPEGKPAGVLCVNLSANYSCKVYINRPKVCKDFTPSVEYCGGNREEALMILEKMEKMTGVI